jgi:hypothetical protein
MSLFDEAKGCRDCKGWLKHCSAECCRGFYIRVDKDLSKFVHGGFFKIFVKHIAPSWIKYFEWHGCRYVHGWLYIPKCEYLTLGQGLFFVRSCCEHLSSDCLCKIFGSVERDRVCGVWPCDKDFSPREGVCLTPNCKYAVLFEGGIYGLD